MKLVQSLMGRRQFLVAAGVTSTSILAFKKLAGLFNKASQRDVAMASEGLEYPGATGIYSDRYKHISSPLKIGDVVLKNRTMQTPSIPRNLIGPENISADQLIDHYANIAKGGCAICYTEGPSDSRDETVNRFYAQMLDAIHFHGSIACTGVHVRTGEGMPPGGAPEDGMQEGDAGRGMPGGGEAYAIGNRSTSWDGDGKL
jgi:hypothetical protein